jgi:predicted ATPase
VRSVSARLGEKVGHMKHDRITQLRISGMRVIDEVTLDLRGLTVLIGDNGSGKSTLLEALELLRKAAKPVNYVSDVLERAHGGLQNLLRRGARELKLGVTVEGAGPKLEYGFAVANVGTAARVVKERLLVYGDSNAAEPVRALSRTGRKTVCFDTEQGESKRLLIDQQKLAVSSFGVTAQPAIRRAIKALRRIEQHVSFETRPLWQQRELDVRVGPRWPAVLERTKALARHALNLPNCYHELQNLGDEVWTRVLERARLGLGYDLRSFRLAPSGRGNIELEVLFGDALDKPLPAECLSEGQLSYLALIALVELNQRRSLLAFDEPEVHLHPALLTRVVWMLEEVAQGCPVIVATHSDGFLDALEDPTSSVVLCELDKQRAMQLRRPNAARLAEWLESYRGLGAIRAEGYEPLVFDDESSDEEAPWRETDETEGDG